MLVVWNARASDKHDNRFPQCLKSMPIFKDRRRLVIVLSPMRGGLFRVKIMIRTRGGIAPGTIPQS